MGEYGRLTPVLDISKFRFIDKIEFKCDCGNIVKREKWSVVRGNTQSCGCLHKDHLKSGRARRSHGLRHDPLYDVWCNMKQRCYYPKHVQFECWGGRGISICNEWLSDFINFYNWAIKNGWEDGLTIDRIDNDKNYCPENCRIATYKINSRNRRTTKLSNEVVREIRRLYFSESVKQVDIAKRFNVTQSCISGVILNKSWT